MVNVSILRTIYFNKINFKIIQIIFTYYLIKDSLIDLFVSSNTYTVELDSFQVRYHG